jgi:ketosteroid isomerase-like protein
LQRRQPPNYRRLAMVAAGGSPRRYTARLETSMTSARLSAVAAALAVSLFCAACERSSLPADQSAVVAEVKAAIKTQVEAYAARDADKAASILAPDIVTMFHGAPNVVGKAAAIEAVKEQMADPALKLEVSDESVDVSAAGDMALYRAAYRFTYTIAPGNLQTTESGNWVAVFRRQADGTMKMSHDMVLDTPTTPVLR